MKKTTLLVALTFSFSAFSQRYGDLVVTAGSTRATYSTSGSDGSDGARGVSGDQGRCESSDGTIAGGTGGRGQDGETGGDAGDLYVIYNQIQDLKNIFITAIGGSGGRGGPGGYGGEGCPTGDTGNPGSDGWSGSDGSLYIIPAELTPFEEETSNTYRTVESLINGRKLVKRIWSEASGAQSLLAPGSTINNRYFKLDGYETGTVQVVLQDEEKIDPKILKDTMHLTLKNGIANVSFGYSFVGIATHSAPANHGVLTVERLYRVNDFESTTFTKITKDKIYISTAKLTPQPELSLKLHLQVKKNIFKYVTAFNGEVPEEAITKTESGYEVDLKALNLSRKLVKDSKVKLSFEFQLSEGELKSRVKTQMWKTKI